LFVIFVCILWSSGVFSRKALPLLGDLSEWEKTPIGYAHPSCVHRVPSGSHAILSKKPYGGTIVKGADGSIQQLAPCRYPFLKYVKKSNTTGGDFAPGWQAWTTYQSPGLSFSKFLGFFNVPNVPQTYNDQTLFMFTGLQNENWIPGPNQPAPPADFEIIQPVLQYGPSAGGGGEYWSLASWYVTVDAGYLVSEFLQVTAGDEIWGNMTLISPDTWFIEGLDMNSGISTNLTVTRPRLKTNPWAYCTLEVYDASGDCSEYPNNNNVYSKLQLFIGSKQMTANWQPLVTSQPICGEHSTVESPSHVSIHFGSS